MRRMLTILWLGALCSGFGCASNRHPKTLDYQTIGRDLNRDTELAHKQNTKAVQLIREGKFDEAEKPLRQALAADVLFGPAHNNLGKVYFKQRKLYLAAWEFQYASKLMPNQPEPRNNLGLVFEAVGRMDDAVKAYEDALKLEPEGVDYIGNAARARLRRGDKGAEVRELLSKLVQREVREQWLTWAKERLALLPKSEND